MESAHGVFLTAYGAIQGWSKTATADVDQVAELGLRPTPEPPLLTGLSDHKEAGV